MNLDFETPITEIETQLAELKAVSGPDSSTQARIAALEKERAAKLKALYAILTPWQTVQVARHPERPMLRDFIAGLTVEFIELHGDRLFGDDQGIIGGFATLQNQQRVMLLGHQKGRDIDANLRCNFGMARPEGYRKALRLMQTAQKFGLPVFTFVDTPGAYPGIGAEERNQSEAIGRNIFEMAQLEVPIVSTIIGEGGSGGALAISVADQVLMLQFSVYSVISPEGCASILWKTAQRAADAAEALGITAHRLKALGLIDKIVSEPVGGAHRDPKWMGAQLKRALNDALRQVVDLKPKDLLQRRYERLQGYGRFGDTKDR